MTTTTPGSLPVSAVSTTRGNARLRDDLQIAYDVRGAGPPMLLLSGVGLARCMWDDELCDTLAQSGFTVVRMDNRDTGESTRFKALGMPPVKTQLLRSFLGLSVRAPYRLEDMGADGFGLMSHLGYERFHVVGASMGGMIAQTMALDHPERLLSLTSMISTPGGRRYAMASPRALVELFKPLAKEPRAQVEQLVKVMRLFAGNVLPFEEDNVRRFAEAQVASEPSPSGSARQMVAILESSGRRRARLPTITTPTLVVHGTVDPLLPLSGGKATARLIPGAELLVVTGMGHILPHAKYPLILGTLARHAHAHS